MKKIKIAVIGVGNMGSNHIRCINEIDSYELYAVCDIDSEKLSKYKDKNYKIYSDYKQLLADSEVDAVTIATPHWLHPEIAIAAIKANKHVLIEKPLGVHKKHVRKLLETIKENPHLKVAAMFNQRTIEAHKKIKSLIDSGELGKISRVSWIVTTWFRTQKYYDSGAWRASWRGEGGGVTINQCPHQFDLFQYFFGMPNKVTANVGFGKYHDIEVEDEFTAFFEYDDGKTGVFISSTGEAPGTNRLEIAADRGKLIFENDKLTFFRNVEETSNFLKNSTSRFAVPENWECVIKNNSNYDVQHKNILENLADAILNNVPLVANASEGVHGLELGNAILLSGLEKAPVTIPIDEDLLEQHFEKLVANSKYREVKLDSNDSDKDFNSSF